MADVRDPHAMGTAVPKEFLHLFRHEVADVRDARFSKVIEAIEDVRLVRERISCFGPVCVSGRSRVPWPPAKMSPFIPTPRT